MSLATAKKSYISEFTNPGSRPEKDFLVSQLKTEKAPQKLEVELRKLQKCSEGGDLAGWKTHLAPFLEIELDLETRVRLKQMELTLFVRASKVARQQAVYAEKKATDAQMADNVDQARQLFQRAQKFNELATYLTDQLKAKTA